jgi:hypothetical protein
MTFNHHARSFRNLSKQQPISQPVRSDESPMFLICERFTPARITSDPEEIAQLRRLYGKEFTEIAVRITHDRHGYTTRHFAGKRFETPAQLLKAWCGHP